MRATSPLKHITKSGKGIANTSAKLLSASDTREVVTAAIKESEALKAFQHEVGHQQRWGLGWSSPAARWSSCSAESAAALPVVAGRRTGLISFISFFRNCFAVFPNSARASTKKRI
jgi:hypothetical protein